MLNPQVATLYSLCSAGGQDGGWFLSKFWSGNILYIYWSCFCNPHGGVTILFYRLIHQVGHQGEELPDFVLAFQIRCNINICQDYFQTSWTALIDQNRKHRENKTTIVISSWPYNKLPFWMERLPTYWKIKNVKNIVYQRKTANTISKLRTNKHDILHQL